MAVSGEQCDGVWQALHALQQQSAQQLQLLRSLHAHFALDQTQLRDDTQRGSELGETQAPSALPSLPPSTIGLDDTAAPIEEPRVPPAPGTERSVSRTSPMQAIPTSPNSVTTEEQLAARLLTAESTISALSADKEALWDQLEAVEEQKRSLAMEATLLGQQVVELRAVLERLQAAATATHADLLAESDVALSRSPSHASDVIWRGTPLFDALNETTRSNNTGSPPPREVLPAGVTHGESIRFGFRLRHPNAGKAPRRQQLGSGHNMLSPLGLRRGGSQTSQARPQQAFPPVPAPHESSPSAVHTATWQTASVPGSPLTAVPPSNGIPPPSETAHDCQPEPEPEPRQAEST
jgi:hypothetical protein